MSIFLNKDSKVIVQGITGSEGSKHTALMLKAGTQVVGGVNARKAGESGAGSREESLCCGKQAVCGTVGRLTGIGGRLALRSGERRSKTET